MSSWKRSFKPGEITVNAMYVMFSDEATGLLKCGYEPMGIHMDEISELERLAAGVRREERRLIDKLADELGAVYGRRFEGHIGFPNENPLQVKIDSALDCVYSDVKILESAAEQAGCHSEHAKLVLIPAGGRRTSPICRLFAPPFISWELVILPSEQIDLVFPSEEAVDIKRASQRFLRARQIIDGAREAYRQAFDMYIGAIEEKIPGITAPKEYCSDLRAAYTEMDYRREPTNAQIIDEVLHYYRAQRLEESIGLLSRRGDVVGYSTRYCGFLDRKNNKLRDIVIHLDPKAKLDLSISTNFGYGRSSYFYSTMSFMGVNLLNAEFIVFYHGIKESEYIRATDVYEVCERSFKQCFDAAVARQHELREIGLDAFIERYVRGSIEKLANLMYIIARSDTFLDIMSLSLFSDIVSGGSPLTMPGTNYSVQDFVLKEPIQTCVMRLVDEAVASRDERGQVRIGWDEELRAELRDWVCIDPRAQEEVVFQLIQLDKARELLVLRLRQRFGEEGWVMGAVDIALPTSQDCQLLRLSGYELLAFRVRKASIVLTLFDNIRKATEAASCADPLESLAASCKLIGEQCREYLVDVLNPEIDRLIQEGLSLKEDIEAIEALGDEERLARNAELEFLKAQRAELRGKVQECRSRGKTLAEYVGRAQRLS